MSALNGVPSHVMGPCPRTIGPGCATGPSSQLWNRSDATSNSLLHAHCIMSGLLQTQQALWTPPIRNAAEISRNPVFCKYISVSRNKTVTFFGFSFKSSTPDMVLIRDRGEHLISALEGTIRWNRCETKGRGFVTLWHSKMCYCL